MKRLLAYKSFEWRYQRLLETLMKLATWWKR